MEVHLIADTNLFFECKALEELPWSELGSGLAQLLSDDSTNHGAALGPARPRPTSGIWLGSEPASTTNTKSASAKTRMT